MEKYKLFDAEEKMMDIIWNNEPINSTVLKNICEEILGWKKSTTYSMVKRLKDRKILTSENAVITSNVTKEEVNKYQLDSLLEKSFDGSLPTFIATFLKDKKLTKSDIKDIMSVIDGASDE